MTQLVPLAACAGRAPEVARAVNSSAWLSSPSLESFNALTVSLRLICEVSAAHHAPDREGTESTICATLHPRHLRRHRACASARLPLKVDAPIRRRDGGPAHPVTRTPPRNPGNRTPQRRRTGA